MHSAAAALAAHETRKLRVPTRERELVKHLRAALVRARVGGYIIEKPIKTCRAREPLKCPVPEEHKGAEKRRRRNAARTLYTRDIRRA